MAGCLLWLKINSFHLWKEEFRHADTLTFKCEQWKINTVWQKVNGVILGKVKFQIFMLLLLPAGLRVPKGALSGINTIVAQGFGTAGQHTHRRDLCKAKAWCWLRACSKPFLISNEPYIPTVHQQSKAQRRFRMQISAAISATKNFTAVLDVEGVTSTDLSADPPAPPWLWWALGIRKVWGDPWYLFSLKKQGVPSLATAVFVVNSITTSEMRAQKNVKCAKKGELVKENSKELRG